MVLVDGILPASAHQTDGLLPHPRTNTASTLTHLRIMSCLHIRLRTMFGVRIHSKAISCLRRRRKRPERKCLRSSRFVEEYVEGPRSWAKAVQVCTSDAGDVLPILIRSWKQTPLHAAIAIRMLSNPFHAATCATCDSNEQDRCSTLGRPSQP